MKTVKTQAPKHESVLECGCTKYDNYKYIKYYKDGSMIRKLEYNCPCKMHPKQIQIRLKKRKLSRGYVSNESDDDVDIDLELDHLRLNKKYCPDGKVTRQAMPRLEQHELSDGELNYRRKTIRNVE